MFPLACTPPWALHSDLTGTEVEQRAIVQQLADWPCLLAVVDLGPRAIAGLTPPLGWTEVQRHTRQVRWGQPGDIALPKNRLKQERRFLREGGRVRIEGNQPDDWNAVKELHVEARDRKGLNGHPVALGNLLGRLSTEPWTFTSVAIDPQGQVLASGGFAVLEDGTCVYSFGGQRRSSESGRASVAMLLAAMRHASFLGCSCFDFGGSQDDGVDQFYAEFGAKVMPMRRWVKAPWWFPWMFSRTWTTWTTASQHA